jgi:hypothetical protein
MIMRFFVQGKHGDSLMAALIAIKRQQCGTDDPGKWDMTLDESGLSATIETDSAILPVGLPAGVECAALPPLVPERVTDLQFRLALNAKGLRAGVEGYVAAASPDVKDWWDRAVSIERENPMIVAAANALAKSPSDIDALFIAAAVI